MKRGKGERGREREIAKCGEQANKRGEKKKIAG